MSRSRKEAIYKDKGIRPYWRHVRRSINNAVRGILHLTDKEDYNIPNPKEVINDYDYSDYRIYGEQHRNNDDFYKRLTRK